jgi:hypothetical protein
MKKYWIRYNTQHGNSDLVWRIIYDSEEVLVKNIKLKVPSFSDTTIENNIVKYNIACYGKLTIENNEATIT